VSGSWLFVNLGCSGWILSTGFGSEFAPRCSDVCTRWLLNTCLPTANPSLASLAVATCDRLTVVISISYVWNLLRTEDVHLRTPALRIGTHFLLTLETVVFLFHLFSTTSKPFSSLSTRLAHAARLGFFYKKMHYINSLLLTYFSWICNQAERVWSRAACVVNLVTNDIMCTVNITATWHIFRVVRDSSVSACTTDQ